MRRTHDRVRGCVFTHELASDVLLDDGLKFLRDAIAFQGDRLFSILVNRSDGPLAGAGEADSDVGVLALAGAVHDASHHGDGHVLDALEMPTPLGHPVPNVR